MRLLILQFVLTLSFQSIVYSQSTKVEALKVGEKVPDLLFEEILNHRVQSAKLSDFKGKLVILDFWSTSCAPCISAFPKIHNLQTKYDKDILILPIGYEKHKGEIKAFIAKRQGTPREIKVPTVVMNDSTKIKYLNSLFPHGAVPFVVWIDKNGLLLGSENGLSLHSQSIEMIVYNNHNPFSIMKKRYMVSSTQPFLINQEKNIRSYGSAFSNYVDSLRLQSLMKVSDDSSVFHFIAANEIVYDYYQFAYSDKLKELNTGGWRKRIHSVSNGSDFYKDWNYAHGMSIWEREEFCRKNVFCYELLLPKKYYSEEDIRAILINDFDRFFRIKSRIENRVTNCLALKRTSKVDKIKSKANELKWTSDETAWIMHMQYTPMTQITNWLEELTSLPIIDETNYKSKVDITLPATSQNSVTLAELKKILNKYDLDLIEVTRKIPMLILTDTRQQ